MRNRIASILSSLAALCGIGFVYALVTAVRRRDPAAIEAAQDSVASSLLMKQGKLALVEAAYAAVKDVWASEWARLRSLQGRDAPRWLHSALAEASAECGFYTNLLMYLSEVQKAGFCAKVGALSADVAHVSYDRRVAEDFKAAWLSGKTKIDG